MHQDFFTVSPATPLSQSELDQSLNEIADLNKNKIISIRDGQVKLTSATLSLLGGSPNFEMRSGSRGMAQFDLDQAIDSGLTFIRDGYGATIDELLQFVRDNYVPPPSSYSQMPGTSGKKPAANPSFNDIISEGISNGRYITVHNPPDGADRIILDSHTRSYRKLILDVQ